MVCLTLATFMLPIALLKVFSGTNGVIAVPILSHVGSGTVVDTWKENWYGSANTCCTVDFDDTIIYLECEADVGDEVQFRYNRTLVGIKATSNMNILPDVLSAIIWPYIISVVLFIITVPFIIVSSKKQRKKKHI